VNHIYSKVTIGSFLIVRQVYLILLKFSKSILIRVYSMLSWLIVYCSHLILVNHIYSKVAIESFLIVRQVYLILL